MLSVAFRLDFLFSLFDSVRAHRLTFVKIERTSIFDSGISILIRHALKRPPAVVTAKKKMKKNGGTVVVYWLTQCEACFYSVVANRRQPGGRGGGFLCHCEIMVFNANADSWC